MLDRYHSSGGEASAVADPVHGVENGDRGVARAQEIAVQRMGPPVVRDRAGSRHQCLADDLAAVYPLPALAGADGPVMILLDFLQIQEVDELVDGFRIQKCCRVVREGPVL